MFQRFLPAWVNEATTGNTNATKLAGTAGGAAQTIFQDIFLFSGKGWEKLMLTRQISSWFLRFRSALWGAPSNAFWPPISMHTFGSVYYRNSKHWYHKDKKASFLDIRKTLNEQGHLPPNLVICMYESVPEARSTRKAVENQFHRL